MCFSERVKLAVCKETGDCVAVKIVTVDEKEGMSYESLRKEVSATSFVSVYLCVFNNSIYI